MTAKVLPFRKPRPTGPCGSGTVPGEVSKPCGSTLTRLYPSGWRCEDHKPRTRRRLVVAS